MSRITSLSSAIVDMDGAGSIDIWFQKKSRRSRARDFEISGEDVAWSNEINSSWQSKSWGMISAQGHQGDDDT